MIRPTLYVADLDGTLLDDNAKLSDATRTILVELLEQGLPFTVASARSVASIQYMLSGISLSLPVVEFNGAFLTDLKTGQHQSVQAIDPNLAAAVFAAMAQAGVEPLLSTFDGQADHLYFGEVTNPGLQWYLEDRTSHEDRRLKRVSDASSGLADQVVCMTVIGEGAQQNRLRQHLEGSWSSELQIDCFENRYNPGWFLLTVHDAEATKEKAVLKLMADRGLAGAELVVFGDAANDFGMFCAADRAIAVANAIPSILERATEVIGPNTDDSVMRFIRDDWHRLTKLPA